MEPVSRCRCSALPHDEARRRPGTTVPHRHRHGVATGRSDRDTDGVGATLTVSRGRSASEYAR